MTERKEPYIVRTPVDIIADAVAVALAAQKKLRERELLSND